MLSNQEDEIIDLDEFRKYLPNNLTNTVSALHKFACCLNYPLDDPVHVKASKLMNHLRYRYYFYNNTTTDEALDYMSAYGQMYPSLLLAPAPRAYIVAREEPEDLGMYEIGGPECQDNEEPDEFDRLFDIPMNPEEVTPEPISTTVVTAVCEPKVVERLNIVDAVKSHRENRDFEYNTGSDDDTIVDIVRTNEGSRIEKVARSFTSNEALLFAKSAGHECTLVKGGARVARRLLRLKDQDNAYLLKGASALFACSEKSDKLIPVYEVPEAFRFFGGTVSLKKGESRTFYQLGGDIPVTNPQIQAILDDTVDWVRSKAWSTPVINE